MWARMIFGARSSVDTCKYPYSNHPMTVSVKLQCSLFPTIYLSSRPLVLLTLNAHLKLMAAPFSTHAVSSLSISPDSSRIATACGDDSATILVSAVPHEAAERYTSLGPSSDSSALETGTCITSLAWDGNSRLYTTDTRGSLTLYATLSSSIPGISQLNQIVAAHSGHALTGVAVSPNLCVTTAKDGLVKAWDPERSTCIARLKGHKGESRAIALGSMDDDMHLLVSAGRDKTVRVWDVRINNASNSANVAVLEGHQGWVHDVAMCAGNHPRIVSCAGDKTVRVWDLVAMKLESVKSGHEFRVWTVAADPTGKFAVSGSTDTTVRYWDLDDNNNDNNNNGNNDAVWEAHGDSVLAVSVAKDASFAVSACDNGSVVKWDIAKMLRGENDYEDNGHKDAQLLDKPKHSAQSPIPIIPPPYADTAPLVDGFLQPTSSFKQTKKITSPRPVAASPPIVAQKKQAPIVSTTELLAPVSLNSTSNINSPRHHLRTRTSPSSSREARSSPGSGKTRDSTPEKSPAVRPRRARNLSGITLSSSPQRASPLSPSRKSEEEKRKREARIKTLEDEVVQREMEVAERDARLKQLEGMMMRREREMETLRKQVESAENLAKQANIRALAAENNYRDNSTSSISTSVDGAGAGSHVHGEVDYSESIDRIERVTGKLRALASKLDGM